MEYHLVDLVVGKQSAAVRVVAPSTRRASSLLVGSPNDVTCERCVATQAYELADLIWNDQHGRLGSSAATHTCRRTVAGLHGITGAWRALCASIHVTMGV